MRSTRPRTIGHLSLRKKRTWLLPLLRPWVRRLALLGFAVSFVFPTTGLGIDLCPLHAVTGLPCPGCGLTRGVSLVSQGDPLLAVGAHAFAPLFWVVFFVLSMLAVVPQARVEALEAKLDVLEPAFTQVGRLLMFAFFGFGLIRFAVFLVLGERFP